MDEENEIGEEYAGVTAWRWRWTSLLAGTVTLVKDIHLATARFWDGIETEVMAMHNKGVQQDRMYAEVAQQIETL